VGVIPELQLGFGFLYSGDMDVNSLAEQAWTILVDAFRSAMEQLPTPVAVSPSPSAYIGTYTGMRTSPQCTVSQYSYSCVWC
jgi:hypothetical protein